MDVLQQVRDQAEKGGVRLSTLRHGTKILVETLNSFYELTVSGSKAKLFGGTCADGTTRFPQEVDAFVVGSTWGGSVVMTDWIGIGMHVEVAMSDLSSGIVTSPVRSITIEEADWSYKIV